MIIQRVLFQLLTKACEPPGYGHGPVSEALSTLRLRFGEPVRFRFLVGMLNSAGGCPELHAAGLRFINTLVETAPHPQSRLYLQAELEQAGFHVSNMRKVSPQQQTSEPHWHYYYHYHCHHHYEGGPPQKTGICLSKFCIQQTEEEKRSPYSTEFEQNQSNGSRTLNQNKNPSYLITMKNCKSHVDLVFLS